MVKQSQGTASTTFVIQGSKFAPGVSVTFLLSEIGPPPEQKNLVSTTSPVHVVVSPDGTFRVAVGQLYSGPLQLGQFTVTATTPAGSRADTDFMILPADPQP